jgi:phosphoribosylamine--glycine ligase
MSLKYASFISGSGTTMEAMAKVFKPSLVVASRRDIEGIKKAQKLNIPVVVINPKDFKTGEQFGKAILKNLKKYKIDFITQNGWLPLTPKNVIQKYKNNIYNQHPGPLPQFGGKGMYGIHVHEAVIKSGQNFTYAVVHRVDEKFDTGQIIKTSPKIYLKKNTTPKLLQKLVLPYEHQLQIELLKELLLKTVMVIDGGGRGSALVSAYKKSRYVGKIIAVPGNDLMGCVIHPELKTTSVREIIKLCKLNKVDLVDVAQDNAIAVGLVDQLKKNKINVFGPTKAEGRLEWDKAYSRKLCQKLGIPQPEFKIFHNCKKGIDYINSQKDQAWFIKASGLAEGKGALPAKNNQEAIKRIETLNRFGDSAQTYLIEKWLKSENNIAEEFSVFVFADGKNYQIIGTAQDHKRALDGDQGENTGGMGCSGPPRLITPKFLEKIKTRILNKIIKNYPYHGVLYLGGIAIKEKGTLNPYLIEFNARWGDPEAELILPGLKNDLYEISKAVIDGKLNTIKIKTNKKYCLVLAACSKGYPLDYSGVLGKEIFGLEKIMKTNLIFSAGVKKINDKYYAYGGRLFYIVTEGKNVKSARAKAYKAIKKISIQGNNLHYRTDIGYRDLKRIKNLF